WYQRGRRAADGRRQRHRHERDLPADQGVRRRLLCPGTPVARSRRPMGREDRQSLPLLAGTPRVRVRPRELTGEVAARCERGGPFCIYLLHYHELRTGNTPKRLATSVRPNLRCTRLATAGFARCRERVNSNVIPIHDETKCKSRIGWTDERGRVRGGGNDQAVRRQSGFGNGCRF